MFELELKIEQGCFGTDIDGPFDDGVMTVNYGEILTIGNSDEECSDIKLLNEQPGLIVAVIEAKGRGLTLRRLARGVDIFVDEHLVIDYVPVSPNTTIRVGSVVLRVLITYLDINFEAVTSREVRCDFEDEDGNTCGARGTMPMVTPYEQATWLCDSCISRLMNENLSVPGMPGAVIDNYQLINLLGSGGFGTVYQAVDRTTKARAAVKVMHWTPEKTHEVARFLLREQLLYKTLTHPNVARYYASGCYDQCYFIAMEFVSEGSLTSAINKFTTVEKIAAIAADLFDALHYLHSLGYVHRDIKPDNLFVTRADSNGVRRGKLGDFGQLKPRKNPFLITRTDVLILSVSYAAPEAVEEGGFKEFEPHSDLYSAAATVYWMLSRRAPIVFPATKEEQTRVEGEEPANRRQPQISLGEKIKIVASQERVSLRKVCDERFVKHKRINDIINLLDNLLTLDPSYRQGTNASVLASFFRSIK
jgi:hypothetical protein